MPPTKKGNGSDLPKMEAFFPFFYWDADRSMTRVGMNDAERWYYIQTLALMYAEGGKIFDINTLKNFLGLSPYKWKSFWAKAGKLLTVEPDGITHRRVIEILEKSQEIRGKRSTAGHIGAQRRWHGSIANAKPTR